MLRKHASILAAAASVALAGAGAQATTLVSDAAAVAIGLFSSCIRTDTGGVKCWGGPYLGDGTVRHATGAVPLPSLASGVSTLALGWSEGCVVANDGGVRCWGWLTRNLGNSTVPRLMPGLEANVVYSTSGYLHNCAITATGGAMCWGNNAHGSLGNGTNIGEFDLPTHVATLTAGVAEIGVGMHRSCALTTAGGVKCWGIRMGARWDEENGMPPPLYIPEDVLGLTAGVTQLAVGSTHACARSSDGGVRCWGWNDAGQLGDGTLADSLTPVLVSGPPGGFLRVKAGHLHTCAQKTSGGLACWGDNTHGQLGTGTTVPATTPQDVVGLVGDVVSFDVGYDHTCAVLADRTVRCWGGNRSGQLGNGTADAPALSPVDTPGLAATSMTAGRVHSCAVRTDGAALCWGDNASGQLGIGSLDAAAVPSVVSALPVAAIRVSARDRHTCAVTAGGALYCWGANRQGQLGTGSTTSSQVPVGVTGLASGATAVAAGGEHTCAVVDGAAKCWGSNGEAQLGRVGGDSLVPVDVTGLAAGVTDIASGGGHSCAITQLGGLKCWGRNFEGAVGTVILDRIPTPVDVSGLTSGVGAVALGNVHSCALTTAGGVKCWGSNQAGQLGGGTASSLSSLPLDVPGLASGVVAIAAGERHSCAVTAAGGVKCWGENTYGQAGVPVGHRLPVTDIRGLAGPALALAAGETHTCALLATGSVQCWGRGYEGQLGNGRFGFAKTPQPVWHAGCANFNDVAPNDPFCANVQWLRNRDVTIGCASEAFCPSAAVTRLGMATLQSRLGAAMTPASFTTVMSSGGFTIGTYPTWSCSSVLPGAPATGGPRRAHVDAVWRARSGGPFDVILFLQHSRNGGVTWSPVAGSEKRVLIGPDQWANVRLQADIDLDPGDVVEFALHAEHAVSGGTSVFAEHNCILRARIDNRVTSAVPF